MKQNKSRYVVLMLAMVMVFSAILFRLANLQLVSSDTYVQEAEDKKKKTLTLTGSRGKILDANLLPLAYDQRCFNVQFYRDPSRSSQSDRKMYTNIIWEVIQTVENNGKQTITEFWLSKDENGKWGFDFGNVSEETAKRREEMWRSNFMLTNTPEQDLFSALCRNYAVPAELSDEDKVKILAVWQEVRMNAFLSTPVTIAYNVDFQTVSELEVRGMELTGVSISESTERVYPKGSLAAHVIGYIGKITSEEALTSYKEKGYPNDALVGLTGIEASMEDQLTPNISYRQGERVVERNRSGKVIRELSYTAPTDGNTVILTIDSRLQAVAEEALAKNIADINKEQQKIMKTERWQRNNVTKLTEYAQKGQEVQTAKTGAVVAMNPKTGAVLAMASSPSFDLSIFTGERDVGAWNDLVNDERNPLLNRAIATKDTPGSVFKMCTALAGLMEGKLTLTEKITDQGPYEGTDTVHPPKCWVSPNFSRHTDQTVVEGLKNSCNFFFFTVGDRLGSTLLSKWAAQLGLTSRTGIELPGEASSFVGNQSMLYDPALPIQNQYTSKPAFSAMMIKQSLRKIGVDRNIEYDEDRLDRVTKQLLDIAVADGTKDEWPALIREVLLSEMNLPSEYIQRNYLVNEFFYYLNDLRWTSNETIMAAIGQSITQVTPIAVARYVSAIANGGTVFDAQIVDKIVSPSGSVVLDKQPVVANQISGAEEYLAAIRRGMEDVTSTENDGTAAKYYKNTRYPMGAKTGTAQRTNVDIENNSWHVAYGPVDDPQIVVVVYVQNGYAGGMSSPTAITIIEDYLDHLNTTETTEVSTTNALAD